MAGIVATQQKYFEWPGGPAEPPFSKFLLTCDNSYTTGGYALTKAQMGFKNSVDVFVEFGVAKVGSTHYHPKWDDVNQKVLILVAATGVEVANAFDLSTLAFWALAFGV